MSEDDDGSNMDRLEGCAEEDLLWRFKSGPGEEELDTAELKDVNEFLEYMGCTEDAKNWTPNTTCGAWCFVFPRANDNIVKGDLKVVEPDDPEARLPVKDPMINMRKIFPQPRKTTQVSTCDDDESFSAFIESDGSPREEVDPEVYHNTIRQKFLSILVGTGISLSHRESVDKDEVFVKAWVELDGKVIRDFAEVYNWSMPFTKEAYEDSAATNYEVPKNRDGQDVPAYATYRGVDRAYEHLLQPFKKPDAIKLMDLFLREWVDLEEMMKQKCLNDYFLTYSARESALLDNEWGSFLKVLCLPNTENIDTVREQFGDQSAFFFLWLAHFITFFAWLSAVAAFAFAARLLVRHFVTTNTILIERSIQFAFTLFMFLWAAVFFGGIKAKMSRAVQKWNAAGPSYYATMHTNHRWNPRVSECFTRLRYTVSGFIVVGYTLAACSLILFVSYHLNQSPTGQQYAAKVTTVLILLLNLGWSCTVAPLTSIENHRMEHQVDRSLALKLIIVKIVMTLFPLVYIAFLQETLVEYCGKPQDLAQNLTFAFTELAGHLCKKKGRGAECQNTTWYGDRLEQSPNWFKKLAHTVNKTDSASLYSQRLCVKGCYPSQCETVRGACSSNCVQEVEDYLLTYFITYCLIDLLFLAWPRINSIWTQQTELAKARKTSVRRCGYDCPPLCGVLKSIAHILCFTTQCEAGIQMHSKSDRNLQASQEQYTYIEEQAKHPKYSFNEWGGSAVDDFFEFAVMFSIVMTFGVTKPVVFLLAFGAFLFMYRLMAYRMVYITRRPFPTNAVNVVVWLRIFEAILALAVITNALMACFFMYPFRELQTTESLVVLFVVEHFVGGVMYWIYSQMPKVPVDVEEVAHLNQEFTSTKLVRRVRTEADDERDFDWYDTKQIDINVHPHSSRSNGKSPLSSALLLRQDS